MPVRKKPRKRSRVAAEVLEGLSELTTALRNRRPLREKFTVRTVELVVDPQAMDAREIRTLRQHLGASQAVFAAVLGVSPASVQAWEQGRRVPAEASLRMMQMFKDDRGLFQKQLRVRSIPSAA